MKIQVAFLESMQFALEWFSENQILTTKKFLKIFAQGVFVVFAKCQKNFSTENSKVIIFLAP